MSEHLEKAKGALAAAAQFDRTDPNYSDMLHVASVQANVAQAAALERIADLLGAAARSYGWPVVTVTSEVLNG